MLGEETAIDAGKDINRGTTIEEDEKREERRT